MSGLRYIANFDSASAMMRALARSLRRQNFPMLGSAPFTVKPAVAVNWLPNALREQVYKWSGWIEAIPSDLIASVQAEEISKWVLGHYPRRKYPAVMLGSSNGAAIHLCAAMGIPWLPQTFLIPIRHGGVHPDESRYSLEAFRSAGRALLDRNPDLQLHHMHDANQDRLMIQRMGYFRVKRCRLGGTFKEFLERSLVPGGTIFILDCQLKWPTTHVGDRHYFQHGALGGATIEEYFKGSERVQEYLARYGSHRRLWDPPPPDGESPEAEWGFEQALAGDIADFARSHRFQVSRIRFREPEDLSPVIADLYRWWNEQQGYPTDTLIVDSFILMDPWLTLISGAMPFWMVFNTEPSAASLEQYVSTRTWKRILLMLFSHGVNSVGVVPIVWWKSILERARQEGAFVGVDEQAYPRDFATFIRYDAALKAALQRKTRRRGQLSLDSLNRFFSQRSALRERVELESLN